MAFSNYEQAGVLLCQLICNSFGLLGVVLIAVLYFGYSNVRIFAFKLVLCLSLSTAGYSIGVLIGPSNGISCTIQATFVSYFSLSTLYWFCIITHSLKVSLINKAKAEGFFQKYLIVGYLVPIPSTLIPAFTKSYTRTALGMCWVNTETQSGKALALLQMWLFIVLAMVYVSINLFRVHNGAKRKNNDTNELHLTAVKQFNRLKWFCIVIYVCWTFALLNILALISAPYSASYALTILHLIFNGLQGVFCLIAFVKDHSVYEALIDTFSTCIPCLIKKRKRILEVVDRA